MRGLGLACLLSAAVAGAAASPATDADDAGDPSGSGSATRAARLSSVDGGVRVVQDSQVVADPAVANMPLFEGAEISTANDGRAEIQLEDGSIARLSPNSTVVLSVLQQQGTGTRTEFVMRGGLAYFELQPSNAEHSLRVNYGDAYFTASNFSVVRLTDDAPPAELAVFTGNVHLERGDALELDVHSGESLTLDATNQGKYNLASTIAPDSWDAWNSDRDQFLNAEAAGRTAATGNLKDYPADGMSDLDASGNWYNVPGQGYVWSPYDAQAQGANWDPYGYGNWVSYPQFGYVWVSGYSWGYSPFQCGLWDYYEDFGWAWAPGYGCSPWWVGGIGWGYRFGNNFPPGYHPPHRPVPVRPGQPKPRQGGGPVPTSPRRRSGAPMIAVDRRSPGDVVASGMVHSSGPAVIAGQTVEPLRPVAPRQAYFHADGSFVNRAVTSPASTYMGGTRSIYAPPARPSSGYTGGYHPIVPRAEPVRPAPMPHYSGGGAPSPAPHPAPPPAPHK